MPDALVFSTGLKSTFGNVYQDERPKLPSRSISKRQKKHNALAN